MLTLQEKLIKFEKLLEYTLLEQEEVIYHPEETLNTANIDMAIRLHDTIMKIREGHGRSTEGDKL
jgi:hypothetical protein